MELVHGVPISEYCDAKRLSVQARLELFVNVCGAVQHAHQKGIIHRDLKPANVLVTEGDGRPTPKVIDFGVAKATEVKLTDLSLADVGAIVGTPAYMSPEQAEPSSMDIDTRTDVYALGVILYELLTGSPPLDSRQFQRGAILEMLRMVREVDPPRPSTKLSTADALPNIAANRSIEPAQLSKLLKGELDWVVMKALEKDRTRRYDTANGLARDIQRYLTDEVVEARPPSRGYRLRKLVKRNKIQVLAASLVFIALVGGIVGTSIGLYQADRARAAADRAREDEANQRMIAVEQKKKAEASEAVAKVQRTRAERREEQAIEAVKKFRDAVADNPQLKDNPALESLRKSLLKQPLAFFRSLRDSLQTDAETNPLSLARLGYAAHDYAHITEEIGDKEDSLRGHLESLAIWERLTRDHPQNEEFQAGLATIYMCQGKLMVDTGRRAEAKSSYDSAAATYQKLMRADPSNSHLQKQLALTQARMGIILEGEGKPTEAMKAFESATAILENLIKANPSDLNLLTNYEADLAGVYMNIGVLQKNVGQAVEALKSFDKALPIWRKHAQDFPDAVVTQGNLGAIYQNIGSLQINTGNPAQGVKSIRTALAIFRKLTETHPTVTEYQDNLATLYMIIAGLQDMPSALESQRRAAAIWRKLIEGHPTVPTFRSSLAGVLHNMASLAASEGRKAEALLQYEEARSLSEEAVRADGNEDHFQINLGNHLDSIGNILKDTGRPTEALVAYQRCLEIRERLTRKNPNSPDLACNLAGLLSNMAGLDINEKRFEEARGRLRRAISLQKQALAIAPGHPTCLAFLKIHLILLVEAATHLGLAEEAAEAQQELYEMAANDPQFAALDARLAAVRKGEAPKDNAERLALAQRAYELGRLVFATKLWADALQSDPAVADDLEASYRYNAACTASLASSWQAKDEPPLDVTARAKLRKQALDWLKAHLAAWKRVSTIAEPGKKERVAEAMAHWKRDGDLASVRDPRELAKLPEDERKEWQSLWADVDSLLSQTQGTKP